MRTLIEQLGGRRFVLTIGCGVVCTILVWQAKIDGAVYRDIILGTVAVYIAGNTWQKNIQARSAGAASDTASVG